MRKVMTILAVAALSASTAFAGGVSGDTEDAAPIVQVPDSNNTGCLNSSVAAVTCGVVAACVGGLCSGGNSSSSSSSSSSSDSSM